MMEDEDDWLTSDIFKGSFQNDYILGEMIGRGSVSTVYTCLYKGRKKFACKMVPKDRLNKSEVRSTVETLLKLRHNNIISVKTVYNERRHLFVITDLASGGELLERLASRGGHSERDAAKAVRDALAALNYLHGMGLWHGSVRPEKLIYSTEDENSRLLLVDRGITTNSLNGYNALYCAPEVLVGHVESTAADIWSLGVVIYIMLCGFEPFRGTMVTFFPSPYWDDKTTDAKVLIRRLMQQRPEDRPTTRDLLLDPWVLGEKSSELPMPNTAKHLREFNARRKFKAATLAVRATRRAMTFSNYQEAVI
ncbi:calcium/calmodulin-dependent protein kinase type IV-like [Neodiprion pinetum]|uniref:Calcium/calmodulin-dependent protein kinase type IV-like n=1 Tax=Neodiprion lecontei TaxID=441921 RepID=A0A6J0C8N3_NEOLC|nr:calcium/calmodulin-dependent protein kinase type IV [Neodiprion lecontei]XP_015522684.1 calcium/calmodulin-dependent protein kinase type IV [Neodiprion lecontei]XP_015522685.1 calcium/calmodulin-dependent protein kinase type IV [Neodiprion lecontei]XP_015522686.1 calcium/calmodulin-dependent protein kinase type IV [Neodiprion lecontei]XP_046474087.1 calcium/calmodulin-dependent protein kinase type IV-like [Neodiprion pinetum]XP_046474088.1 calcium/calmodulin-dependent protein kinase type IV